MTDTELSQTAYAIMQELALTFTIELTESMLQLIEGWMRAYRLERGRIAQELPRV